VDRGHHEAVNLIDGLTAWRRTALITTLTVGIIGHAMSSPA
jgi:hypothetical protein